MQGPVLSGAVRQVASIVVALFGVAQLAAAQEFPSKPVRIIIPYAAGGSSDIQTRMIAQRASERLKQPVVVENRPGGNATIGVNAVARSPNDGYTLGFINLPAASHVFNKELPYNPDKDFDPIVGIYRAVYAVAVSTALPVRTLREFVDYARANPGKINFAAHVITARLTMESLMSTAGLKMVPVQYKGTAPALQAVLVNEIQAMFDLPGVFGPLVRDGKARVVAITGDQRIAQLPDVPSMAELGFPQVRSALTVGFWGPAGIPPANLAKLSAALAEAIRSPEVAARMAADGVTPNPSSPEELRVRYRAEVDFWTEAARIANFKPE